MKFLCGFIILAVIYTMCQAEENEEITFRLTDKLIQCSNKLSKFVLSLCDKKYKIIKRDVTSVMMEKMLPEKMKMAVTRQQPAAMRWRRVRRQIASECCNRPCTIGTIIWYCADQSRLVQENPEIFQ